MVTSRIDIKERLKKFQRWTSEEDGKAIFLTPGSNFFYLTGFDTDPMERLVAVVVAPEASIMIAPLMLEDQIKKTSWPGEIFTWQDGEDPFRIVSEVLSSNKINKLAVERNLGYYIYELLKKLGIKKFNFVDERFTLERIRKTKSELDAIRTAVRGSEASYNDALNEVHRGITEIELAGILEYHFTRHSIQKPAFGSIVAFGENSAIPHHLPSKRRLRSGDIILIDFGGKFGGYSSDTTRTCAFEGLSDKMRNVYAVVKEAQEKSLGNIVRGSKYSSIDNTARKIISRAGYGEFFTHRVGHGLGVSVHEEPYLNSANEDTIQEGVVFTIEPGIYLKGSGGVRIEDTVLFDGKAAKPFNRLQKELIIL